MTLKDFTPFTFQLQSLKTKSSKIYFGGTFLKYIGRVLIQTQGLWIWSILGKPDRHHPQKGEQGMFQPSFVCPGSRAWTSSQKELRIRRATLTQPWARSQKSLLILLWNGSVGLGQTSDRTTEQINGYTSYEGGKAIEELRSVGGVIV